jgi:hypothetical protein
MLETLGMISDLGCSIPAVTTIAATHVGVIAKMMNFRLMKSNCPEQLLLVFLEDRACHK